MLLNRIGLNAEISGFRSKLLSITLLSKRYFNKQWWKVTNQVDLLNYHTLVQFFK